MSTPEPNPLELSEIDIEPAVHSRVGKGPRAADFGQLMLQFCLLGGVIALTGALLFIAFWQHRAPIWILLVGLPMFFLGVVLFCTGRALGVYKVWAWYVAVVVLVPVNLAVVAVVMWISIVAGAVGLVTLFAPVYCGYVLWTLLSKSGREHYWRSAAGRIEADRKQTVRKPFRRR